MTPVAPPADPWRSRLVGVALVNTATLAWATNVALGRWLRADIGPLTLAALRFSVVGLVFLALLRRLPPWERRLGPEKWWLVGMALTGVAAFSPLLYWGLHSSTAVNCALIQGFAPLITALIAGVLIAEPVTRRQIAGAVLGLVGVLGLLASGSGGFFQHFTVNPGDVILLASAGVWALYSVLGRRVMRTRSPLAATAFSVFLALPLLWAAATAEMLLVQPPHFTPATGLAVLHICLVPTLVGFWAWNQAVRALGAGGAMVFYNTLPLYGVLLGALLLHEPLGFGHLGFGGLILAGGVWATLERSKS